LFPAIVQWDAGGGRREVIPVLPPPPGNHFLPRPVTIYITFPGIFNYSLNLQFMERRDFVSNLSMALALACAGGLAACSKSDSGDPDPNPGGGGNALLTANLGSELQNPGDYKIGGGVILIRIADGNTVSSFAALSSTCTHQGCTVARFNSSTNLIECNAPCGHGSR